MPSSLIRVLFALTAIAPLLVSVSYVFFSKHAAFQPALIAALGCILLGAIAIKIIKASATKLERIPVKVKKAKSADKEVVGYYIAYVLPLLFKDSTYLDPMAIAIAVVLLFFVLLTTRSFQVNPVLGLFGYRFFEAEMEDGMTYLLVTSKPINNLKAITEVVQLSDYGLLDSSGKK